MHCQACLLGAVPAGCCNFCLQPCLRPCFTFTLDQTQAHKNWTSMHHEEAMSGAALQQEAEPGPAEVRLETLPTAAGRANM
jgi:hypothetical protein